MRQNVIGYRHDILRRSTMRSTIRKAGYMRKEDGLLKAFLHGHPCERSLRLLDQIRAANAQFCRCLSCRYRESHAVRSDVMGTSLSRSIPHVISCSTTDCYHHDPPHSARLLPGADTSSDRVRPVVSQHVITAGSTASPFTRHTHLQLTVTDPPDRFSHACVCHIRQLSPFLPKDTAQWS